jgi:type II secretory pathway pseudopilin PulG
MIASAFTHSPPCRRGITLTEILIAIMILGVGLVSLATLFPIGLARLREATRYSRTAFLKQSAESDMAARGLLNSQSFAHADYLNLKFSNPPWRLPLPFWFATNSIRTPNAYNPLIQDTQSYGGESHTFDAQGNETVWGARATGLPGHPLAGPGLPFAYDPLWRFQTGIYPDPIGQTTLEARFGYGIGFVRTDPDRGVPSAWGLQRLTNFNHPFVVSGNAQIPIMPAALYVPSMFVSPEDYVWVDPTTAQPATATAASQTPTQFSPVLPDMTLNSETIAVGGQTYNYPLPQQLWRFSWMFTGLQTSASNGSSFDGSIVIFENRPFSIAQITGPFNTATYQVAGETVVEAVYGYSTSIQPKAGPGYGVGVDRTVLLRWPAAMQDPVIRVGDWIADVTYERNQLIVRSRWWNTNPVPTGFANPANNFEWDNLPAQRCNWYQVQKVTTPANATGNLVFSTDPGPYRYMMVYVDQALQAKTLLMNNNGVVEPRVVNAALIAPNVVNVIPTSIFVR